MQLREYNARLTLAWHIAAFQRAKRLPKLDRLYLKEPKRKQSWQEQYALAQQWVASAEKRRQMQEKLNGR